MQKQQHIMVIAGEASGDMHGARLVEEMRRQNNTIQFSGMGSQYLREAGVDLLVDSKSIAVIGLLEVLAHWGDIKKALKTIEAAIRNNPPDLLILIDYVEFNLRMAAIAKQVGVKVLFYVSPQIWAWRPERVHKIGAVIDMMAVLFPFELKYYEEANIPVRYVGHPLTGKVKTSLSREQFLQQYQLSDKKRIIGILPGSRKNEIKKILPILLDAAVQLNKKHADLAFLLPVAPTLDQSLIEKCLAKHRIDNIQLINGQAYDVMQAAESIMITSGTATLEAALMGVPMVIVYKVNFLTWLYIRYKIQVKHVGLANIVAGKPVVPELLQLQCTAPLIAAEMSKQLSEPAYQRQIRQDLAHIKTALGNEDSSVNVARLAFELLE